MLILITIPSNQKTLQSENYSPVRPKYIAEHELLSCQTRRHCRMKTIVPSDQRHCRARTTLLSDQKRSQNENYSPVRPEDIVERELLSRQTKDITERELLSRQTKDIAERELPSRQTRRHCRTRITLPSDQKILQNEKYPSISAQTTSRLW